MPHPLLERLVTELGWASLADADALEEWVSRPGARALLIPGDPAKNLETADAAVIAPELLKALGGLEAAIVADPIERIARERFETWPTPSLIFLRDGAMLGAIPKVRDWDDYLARARMILSGDAVAAE
jgi:hydrogenase-1 operon protein HyaE